MGGRADRDHRMQLFPRRDVSVQTTFGGMPYRLTTAQRGLLTFSPFVVQNFIAYPVFPRSEMEEGQGVPFHTPEPEDDRASRIPRSSIQLFAVTTPTLGVNDWPLSCAQLDSERTKLIHLSVPNAHPPFIGSHVFRRLRH